MRSSEKRCFRHPSPLTPSGEENILTLVWKAKKMEAAQEIDTYK